MLADESQVLSFKTDLQSNYLQASISGSGRQADQVLSRAFDQQWTDYHHLTRGV